MKKITYLFIILIFLSSCRIFNPSQMLRTGSDYKFSKLNDTIFPTEYRLAPNDEFYFNLYTNDGEKLIDPLNTMMNYRNLPYIVEFDGMAKLPILGRINLKGLTIRETEKLLETKYSLFFNKPFAQIKVVNNRVTIFPGGLGGTARVLTLTNTNTTLFEALALVGGISDGKAHKIKLIRGSLENPDKPQVFLIDLSKIENTKQGNIVLQANDIIYVDPRDRVPQKILEGITPYLTLLSTILLIYSIINK